MQPPLHSAALSNLPGREEAVHALGVCAGRGIVLSRAHRWRWWSDDPPVLSLSIYISPSTCIYCFGDHPCPRTYRLTLSFFRPYSIYWWYSRCPSQILHGRHHFSARLFAQKRHRISGLETRELFDRQHRLSQTHRLWVREDVDG